VVEFAKVVFGWFRRWLFGGYVTRIGIEYLPFHFQSSILLLPKAGKGCIKVLGMVGGRQPHRMVRIPSCSSLPEASPPRQEGTFDHHHPSGIMQQQRDPRCKVSTRSHSLAPLT